MSKKIIYNEIRTQVLDNSTVKHFKLWNSQIDKLDDENAFNFPAVFLEFSDMTFVNRAAGIQEIEGVVTLYIVQEELRRENNDNLDFIDTIALALNGFQTDTILSPLKRIAERQDSDHDQLIVWEQDYNITALDCTSSKYNDAIMIPEDTVELELPVVEDGDGISLIIQNDNIRTAKDFIDPVDPPVPDTFEMLFDGNNEYISHASFAGIDFERTDSFSWGGDFTRASITNMRGCGKWLSIGRGYNLALLTDRIAVQIRNGSVNGMTVYFLVTIPTIKTNIYVTYDGSSSANGVKCYVNGIENTSKIIQSNNLTGTISHTTALNYGTVADLTTGALFSGLMDKQTIFAKNLTAAAVLDQVTREDMTTHADAADLVLINNMGEDAVWDGSKWNFPAVVAGQTVGQSVNMEEADRIEI